MRQVRLKIDTSFAESKNAAIAIEYLNSGEIFIRDGLEIALSCLFSPLGAAASGESPSQVQLRCELSRTQFETYMTLAINRAKALNLLSEESQQIEVSSELETISPIESDSEATLMDSESLSHSEETVMASGFSSNDKPLYIDFDSEEF